jgi:membrane-bound lytic murein transglycosylase B
MRRFWSLTVLLAALALAACQTVAPPARTQPGAAPAPIPPGAEAPVTVKPGFEAWLAQLRADALARGISRPTVETALAGLAPIPRVLELDRRQPEFTQTFWRYLDGAVTARRVADGQAMLKQHAALLRRIEQRYGVPPRFLVAFWGLETNYGKGMGGFPVVGALATLAYDGRRAEFFRTELFNALQILDRRHIAPAAMVGSWAGAMGQTQFMPSTFLKYAVDEDGDGRMNIWTDVQDALASAANYLKALGWDGARTWGREVVLPEGFDPALASIDPNAAEIVKTLPQWAALGLRQGDGAALPRQEIAAALVLPAGIGGPAFLVYENYRAILKWNRSTFYAIAVGHLADRLAGGPALVAPRREEEPLRRDEVLALQAGLHRLGYLNGDADGVVGASTRQAVRAFQRARGLPADGYASRSLIKRVGDANVAGA